jgi:TolB-like protein
MSEPGKNGFISELKRRNVFRVAIAYIVAGWLLAQVADLAADAFNAPEWVMQMLIVLLLLGLPVALFLAWAYELTPEGVKLARDLPADMPKDPRSKSQLNRITLVALIVAVAWLGWDKLQRPAVEPADDATAAIVDKSIAVLPFADFSPDSDHAWFADGLTDEILNALARTRDLRVASRTSAFAYRDSDLDATAIANEIGVAHILEGSVRRSGDRIRVTAQLIRAADDAHLWSETFDASSDDSIEIQEQIAFEIASLLDTAMDPEELRRMVAAGTESIAAWEAYVQMRELRFRMLGATDFTAAPELLRLYQDIVREDPEFAEAHLQFAIAVYAWLSPALMDVGPAELSADELQQLFSDATANAMRYARNEQTKLGAEILRARVEMRLTDIVELTREQLEYFPYDRDIWLEHLTALFDASLFDDARAFVREFQAHDFANDEGLVGFYAMAARIDLEAGLDGIERLLAMTSVPENGYYQSHRVFLYDDRVDEAAGLAQRYLATATNTGWTLMVKIRQACAEGRVADAEKLYEEFDFSQYAVENSNLQWLALKTLGRVEEANALLQPLDRPENLGRLIQLLTYTHFDPAPYPNLTAHLEKIGVMRREVTSINFACKR